MKQNDWLVAGLNNPDYSISDFFISGLNIDNTQLLSEDQYKTSSFIRDQFTENGVFNEDAFNKFYKKKAQEFGRLSEMDTEDNFLYDPFDTRAKDDSPVNSPKYDVEMVANSNRDTTMLSGATYAGNLSQRELAQQSKIWDSEKQEWRDETPNDFALSNSVSKWAKSLFDEPLVYAVYNEDGEHYDNYTGQTVKHKKGQYKLNQYGLPYTETLNGRSLIGKEVVSQSDLLTVDGQGVNKYDFFDSDSLDKSVTGTVLKTATAIAPLLMGPYVAPIYSGVLVARELSKSLPMLYGITTAWFDMPQDNATLNKLAGIGQKFTTSTSDAGRSSMLNTEVAATLIGDVALQFGQQRVIATGVQKLRGVKNLVKDAQMKSALEYEMQKGYLEDKLKKDLISQEAFNRYVGDPKNWRESVLGSKILQKNMKDIEPLLKRTNRLGADASLAYMALVSNTDVYSSMLEAGASKKEAATIALASTIGMFSVDRFTHLGELFFDDLTAESEHQLRRTFTKDIASWYKNTISQTAKDPNASEFTKFKNIFQTGIDYGKKHTNQFLESLKYHTTGFIGKAVGEGLEEVSEEFVTDLSKGLYELAGALGMDTTVKDVGAFKDWQKRYGMSFLGGTLGGGIFYGVNLYQNGKFNIDQTQDELIYLVRNGRTKEVLDTLEKWRKKGKFGSKSLSTKTTIDENNNEVFLTAESEKDSQNEFIYNRIRETVLQLDNIINGNQAKLSEDELFDNMILSEARFRELQKYLDIKKESYITGYQKDYQRALSNVVNLEAAYKKAQKTITGIAYSSEEEYKQNLATDEQLRHLSEEEKKERSNNLKKIEEDLKIAKEELERFLSGEYSMEYTEKLLFALDPHLNEDFVALTYDQWLKKNHDGKTVQELTEAESNKYKEEYLIYKQKAQEKDLDQKFSIYKKIKEQMNPVLLNIQQNSEKFKVFHERIKELSSTEFWQARLNSYNYDSVLDFAGETEDSESYINRNNPENRNKRLELIDNENKRIAEELKNDILKVIDESGGFIDPILRRDLKLILLNRNKDILKSILSNVADTLATDHTLVDADTGAVIEIGQLNDLDESILQLMNTIDVNNLQSSDAVWTQIQGLIFDKYFSPIKQKNQQLSNLKAYLQDSDINILSEDSTFYGEDFLYKVEDLIAEGKTIDEIFNVNNTELYGQNFEDYELSEATVASFLQQLRSAYESKELSNYKWDEASKKVVEESLEYKKDLSYYNDIFKDYLNRIKSNPIINLNQELDKRVANINPVIDLVKSLGLSLNTNINNLEQILDALNQKFDEIDDLKDLTLISQEKESLEEAAYILKLAKSYLYAASATPNIIAPYGHNGILNDFAKNHKDIYKNFEQLAVLPVDIASMYEQEISRYLRQIGIKDEKTGKYNSGSWLFLSNRNEIDKAQKFIRAEKAWNKTCYDFFSTNAKYFKFTYEGTEYSLLEGFESIPKITEETQDALIHLNKLFDLLHNNVQNLINQGWTYKQIWERSGILKNITKLEEVPLQKTCSLNEHITVDRLTSYDKMVLLTTAASMDSTKFYSYIRERVSQENGIVPLTIQEWVSRVGIAQLENPDIFNQTLEYIKQETKDPRPIIYGTYIAGNAGAGKSRVVGRNIALYNKNSNIWLSAPKTSQVNTLFESTTVGTKMLNREQYTSGSDTSESLISRLGINMDAYQDAMKLISDPNASRNRTENPYFSIIETAETLVLNINFDKFGVKKIDKAPDMIIIDEVTHLNNLELQLISEVARLNNIKLIMLGDDKQKGNTLLGRNIDREQCLTIRTPNLGISLRDNNIQHQFNLQTLEELINQLSYLDADDTVKYQQGVEQVKSLLNSIKFKVYYQDDINGDFITESLTESYASKLSGTVGYVGRKPSKTLETLHNLNLNVTELQELDIQGQEFDYVVIDKDFNIPRPTSSGVQILEFLQDLYTMISRGKKGAIIIDPNYNLSNVIGSNRVEFAKAIAPSILEYAGQFRQEKLALLDKALGKSKEKESKEVKNTENKEPEKESEEAEESEVKEGEGESPKKDAEKSTPQIEVISDTNFDINSLDTENNYYLVSQIKSITSDYINEMGFPIAGKLEDETLWCNESNVSQIIGNQKQGKGFEGADAFIVLQFPKSEFGELTKISEIQAKLEELGQDKQLIKPQYINNIVKTTVEEIEADEKTDPSQAVSKPKFDPKDLEQILDENDVPKDLEDIPDNPLLCYGEATFTGLEIEMKDDKEVWINPKPHIGKIIGKSRLRNGYPPAIKSYENRAGVIDIELGTLHPNGHISPQSQFYISREDLIGDNGEWLLENSNDAEFKVSRIIIRTNGDIIAHLENVEFKDGDFGGFEVQIKEMPFDFQLKPKRDIQLFTDKDRIEDSQEQIDLSNLINEFKCSFLYNDRNYQNLDPRITSVISETSFNNIKWKIQVKARDSQDNFIRNIGFQNEGMEIGSEKLVYQVIGEVELKDGSTGYITLGLMANPKTWIEAVPESINRIDKKIKKLEKVLKTNLRLTEKQKQTITNSIEYYKQQKEYLNLDNPNSGPRQYSAYIDQLTEMYKKQNPEGQTEVKPVIIEVPRLITPGLTNLHKQGFTVRLSRKSKELIKNTENRIKQLNENLKKAKGDSRTTENILTAIAKAKKKLKEYQQLVDSSFRSLNPYTIVSPTYIYTPNSAIRNSTDIDDSIIGRYNVVFVTNKPKSDPEKLVNIYIQQKNQAAEERKEKGYIDFKNSKITPSVRMMVLENLGVSFQDLSNPYLADSMKSEVKFVDSKGKVYEHSQIYPFKTNYMGVRMYVSLWNFRANLLQFNREYNKFIKTLPIEESKLDLYLAVKDLIWREENGKKISKTGEEILKQNRNLKDLDKVSKLVDEFNDSLGNKVKQFRLGSDVNNGAYIRRLTGDIKSLYQFDETKTSINGIYINSATYKKYLDIMNSLFENVLDQIITANYPIDRLLSTKLGVKNSFSGKITSLANTNGEIEIVDSYSGEKLTCHFGRAWEGTNNTMNSFSHIPAVLSKVFKFTSIRQGHLLGDQFDLENIYSIKLKGTIEQDGTKKEIEKVIPYDKIWEHINMARGAISDDDYEVINNYVFDDTLSNLFSFVFHGTLEDIHSTAQKASDALFPKGFFADPLSTSEIIRNGQHKMFTKSVQQQIFFGSNVRVGFPTFYISLKDLKDSIETAKTPVTEQSDDTIIRECNSLIANVKALYPQISESLDTVLDGFATELSNSDMKEFVINTISETLDGEIRKNSEKIFVGNNVSVDKNLLILKKSETEALSIEQIVRQLYQEQFGLELEPIDQIISINNRTIEITSNNVTLRVAKKLDGGLMMSKIGGEALEESKVVTILTNLLNNIGRLNSSQKQALENVIAKYKKTPDERKAMIVANDINGLLLRLRNELKSPTASKLIAQTIQNLKEPNCK